LPGCGCDAHVLEKDRERNLRRDVMMFNSGLANHSLEATWDPAKNMRDERCAAICNRWISFDIVGGK
jgi:hypothetical protein